MNLLEQAAALGIEGFLHPDELEQLADLAAGKDVLEIGSYRGLSAWGMAQFAKSVYCVDTFKAWTNGQTQNSEDEGYTTLDAFLAATQGLGNVNFYPGTSESAAEVVEGTFDFIFLDAMHDYDNVAADIRRWWPRVRPGGVMAFHDYAHAHYPGVKQAVDEAFGLPEPGTVLVTLRWVTKV